MSYCRYGEGGHYIWSDGEIIHFDDNDIPEDVIDIFLYRLYKLRKTEFKYRVNRGEKLIKEWKDKYEKENN